MEIAIIIPVQGSNKYHKDGDLAPFGDTTLLEWKISQCIESYNASDIYIVTNNEKAKKIAENNGLNIINREEKNNFSDLILNTVNSIDSEHIMWMNCTSPFINNSDYKNMIKTYKINLDKFDSLITTSIKKDFIYFNDNKLNFDKHTDGRGNIQPIYLATNGVYINSKKNILKDKEITGNKPYFYNLDFLESLEIKDMQTYSILSELISLYFKKELNV